MLLRNTVAKELATANLQLRICIYIYNYNIYIYIITIYIYTIINIYIYIYKLLSIFQSFKFQYYLDKRYIINHKLIKYIIQIILLYI